MNQLDMSFELICVENNGKNSIANQAQIAYNAGSFEKGRCSSVGRATDS